MRTMIDGLKFLPLGNFWAIMQRGETQSESSSLAELETSHWLKETDIRVVKTKAPKNMQEIVLEKKELNKEKAPNIRFS